MAGHDIIVIGASAGGVQALQELVRGLPEDLAAALFVTVHLPDSWPSVLPDILNAGGHLPASHPTDGARIEPGRIYVAPPGYHLLIGRGNIELSHGPRENGFRPAIDPLFRSAARAYGTRVIGVVLSGSLSDGALGLADIHARGGITVVQDPEDALYPTMPESALALGRVDHVLPAGRMAEALAGLVDLPAAQESAPMEPDPSEAVERDLKAQGNGDRPNQSSVLTCPECGGVLWEFVEGNLVQYRCHVGHAYSIDALHQMQTEAVEVALWAATRALVEKAVLHRRLAERARRDGRTLSAVRFERQAEEASGAADLLRGILTDGREREDE